MPHQGTPNPFFGNRVIKKGTPIHVKDEFNPFKHNKINKAAEVCELTLLPMSKSYVLLRPHSFQRKCGRTVASVT